MPEWGEKKKKKQKRTLDNRNVRHEIWLSVPNTTQLTANTTGSKQTVISMDFHIYIFLIYS